MRWSVRGPWREEWRRFRALLREAGLPVEGVGPETGDLFLVAVDAAGQVAGGVGLQGQGADVLLRSLVVASGERGSGLGGALIAAVEQLARDRRVERIYVLTETAEAIFSARGYSKLPRDRAPGCIRQTAEFAVLCPASARLMVKRLDAPGCDRRDEGPVH